MSNSDDMVLTSELEPQAGRLEREPTVPGTATVLDTIRFDRLSRRWVKLLDVDGSIAASGASDYESSTIEIWPYDCVVVEWILGGNTGDADIGIRLRDVGDNANLNGYNVLDLAGGAAIMDVAAAFGETALNIGGTAQYHQYVLQKDLPIHSIRVYAENDDGANAGTYEILVFGRVVYL